MTDSYNSQEQFPDSTERDKHPLNFDVDSVGESHVEGGEIPLNPTECALTANIIGTDVIKARSSFLREAA